MCLCIFGRHARGRKKHVRRVNTYKAMILGMWEGMDSTNIKISLKNIFLVTQGDNHNKPPMVDLSSPYNSSTVSYSLFIRHLTKADFKVSNLNGVM